MIPVEVRRRICVATRKLTRKRRRFSELESRPSIVFYVAFGKEKTCVLTYLPAGGRLWLTKVAVDGEWLLEHATDHPHATLKERIDAWEKHSGRRVALGTMWNAMKRIGFTHKKTPRSPTNESAPTLWKSDSAVMLEQPALVMSGRSLNAPATV